MQTLCWWNSVGILIPRQRKVSEHLWWDFSWFFWIFQDAQVFVHISSHFESWPLATAAAWIRANKKLCGVVVPHRWQWSMSLWDENCYFLFPVPSFLSRSASQCHRLYRQLVVTCHLSTENMHISYLDIFRPCTVKLTQGTIWSPDHAESMELQAAYSGPTSETKGVASAAARFHRGPLFSPHLARSFLSCCWMACLNATASGLETWVFLA